jgi:hypothetical protein
MAEGFIPVHGGYADLLSYRKAEIVYDATVYFYDRFFERRGRTRDQMVQAARSGKQNIIARSAAARRGRQPGLRHLQGNRNQTDQRCSRPPHRTRQATKRRAETLMTSDGYSATASYKAFYLPVIHFPN